VGLLCWGVVAIITSSPASKLFHTDPPVVHLTSLVKTTTVVPGTLGSIAWPTTGEGAVAVLGSGLMAQSPKQVVQPIASLTKMMTAFIILRDHPLSLGEGGPKFTMTETDVKDWIYADQTDESNVPVKLGEVLDEFQLLEALMIPSADNIADYLARWDAGSITAFTIKMNAEAQTLGLSNTHYVDASGINPGSRSTAADQAILASHLMQNPVLRSIVKQVSVPFQVAGKVWNYNPGLGVDGIIGVKSGYTSHAGACLATAAYRTVGNMSGLVIAVTLNQPFSLQAAATADEALLTSVTPKLKLWRPTFSASALAQMTVGSSVTPLALEGSAPVMIAWPGMQLSASVRPFRSARRSLASPVVAELRLADSVGIVANLPLVATTVSSMSSTTTTIPAVTAADRGVKPQVTGRPSDTREGG
jgi:D-alanyl-D-alanine carboxypeptidase (penicillin-binding protein 5/6)